MSARGTGWLQDREPERDYRYGASSPFGAVTLPRDVQPRLDLIRWRDQGRTNSCTGHACVGAFEIERALVGLPRIALSPRHAYQNALAYADSSRIDGGAYLRDAIRGLVKLGVAREDICPLTDSNVLERPSLEAEIDGFTKTAARYERILESDFEARLAAVMRACAEGHGVIDGKVLTDAYEQHSGSDALPPPKEGDVDTTGHATYYLGYRTELGGSVSLFEVGSWSLHRWGISSFAIPCGGWVAAEWLMRCRDLLVAIAEPPRSAHA